jgi:hypothetical protein
VKYKEGLPGALVTQPTLNTNRHRSFKPAGEERLANDDHQIDHQNPNTTTTTPTCAGMERPVIADKLTSHEMCAGTEQNVEKQISRPVP